MDWFSRITGFLEADYNKTRAQLEVDGSALRSKANGKSYSIGDFELVSLETLRARVAAGAGAEGRPHLQIVTGDVRKMHQAPEYAGALFQVASQFNALEMVGPGVTPEDGVTRYEHDRTQGPACAIAAGADESTIRVGILHSLSGTMAISESALKDTVLMLIDDQNRKGGLLGRKLVPVVADPASDWGLFAEKARDLLTNEGVAVVFGCWTSASRKAVLPVFEQMNGLLYYPVQYEGEESSRNIFYTGAAPNQQAIPAVQYLMSKEGGEIRRWVLLGTDYVYPRTTNRILEAYLASEGVPQEDIITIYTPFGYSDWRDIIQRIKAFGSTGKKTAVISTINGDANTYFYKELAAQKVDASAIPVMAFCVGERELLGVDAKPLAGHLAAWNYFHSVKSPENEAFIKMWKDFTDGKDEITNDPMEATFIGFRMWAQAVVQAGTTDVNAVRQAMYGQRVKAPSGFEEVMNTNHHLSKPVMIGRIDAAGKFEVISQSINPVRADAWSKYIPDSARRTADWTFPWVCGGCVEPTFKDW